MAVKALMDGSSLADALNADYSTGTVSDFDEDADYDYNSDDEDLSFLEILFVILFFYFLFMWPTVFIVRFLFALITKDWSSFKPRWKILFLRSRLCLTALPNSTKSVPGIICLLSRRLSRKPGPT